jgi:hypothetical protein
MTRDPLKVPMDRPATSVTIALRIPGTWSRPRELSERLPTGFSLTPESLILPDATRIDCWAMRADRQFADIFRSSCRRAATEDELATVDNYKVNVVLSGPGGSVEAARKMMQAGAAVVRAGGAGVFIDNSALAHGGRDWLDMTEDASPDALSFAFVAIVRGKEEVWTMGMHVLGFRDVEMKRVDADANDMDIIEILRYICRNEKPVEDGDIIADPGGLRYQTFLRACARGPEGTPMHNPFGSISLLSMRDIAETN